MCTLDFNLYVHDDVDADQKLSGSKVISNPTLVWAIPADCQPAWVDARLTVRMTVGAEGRENSVAVHLPLLRLRLRPPAAG